jgi:hypothetical protein
MHLPNGDRADIPMEKLVGYCLNPNHSSGKHKARVFASALGITSKNAGELLQLIRQAAVEGEVVQQSKTEFGQLFKVDWLIPGTQSLELRTIWEIKDQQSFPRIVSAFIK